MRERFDRFRERADSLVHVIRQEWNRAVEERD